MSHQIIITLSDDEYATLAAVAQEKGQQLEDLAHQALQQRYSSPNSPQVAATYHDLLEQMRRNGEIVSLATNSIDASEDSELASIASSIVKGKPASEMISEDRGPY